jgi:FSR family fosmidomycin resistance protein-like MFS transporter
VIGRLVPEGADRRSLVVLSLGHVGSDVFQGAVPALLPFLLRDRGYSYAALGALYLCASIGSSVVQPLFGLFADRVRASSLMPAGLDLGGVGIGLAGVAPTYGLTAASLLAGGFGVAAFHPEAARFASYAAGPRRGAGMSLFALGGNAGFALGPLLVTPAVLLLGLRGTALVALVPLAAAAAVWSVRARLETLRPPPRHATEHAGEPSDWREFGLASGAATLRTAFQFGLQAFVPVWFVTELGTGEAAGNAAVTALLAAGAAGTLVGGRVADRIGFRPLIAASLALVVPLALLLASSGIGGAFALLVAIGFCMDANFYPLVVVAQTALPRHVGFASGVVLGLSISIGALAAWLLGVLADHAGITSALYAAAGLAAAALACALALQPVGRPVRLLRGEHRGP